MSFIRGLYHTLYNPEKPANFSYPASYTHVNKFTRLIQEEHHRRNPPPAPVPPPKKKDESKDKVCTLFLSSYLFLTIFSRSDRLVTARNLLLPSLKVTMRPPPLVKPWLTLPPPLTRYLSFSFNSSPCAFTSLIHCLQLFNR